MKASILLVGTYAPLLMARALILQDWQSSIANVTAALRLVKDTPYDLLILCQTVPDEVAVMLVDLACPLSPHLKVLALARNYRDRDLGTRIPYRIALDRPAGLITAVASILGSDYQTCS